MHDGCRPRAAPTTEIETKERFKKIQKRRQRSQLENDASSTTVVLDSSSNSSGSNSDSSSSEYDAEWPGPSTGVATCPPRKRGRLHIISSPLAAMLDRNLLSDRTAMMIIFESAKALGHDPEALALNQSTIRRLRRNYREAAANGVVGSFMPSTALTVHWDGKLMPDLTGREKVDRLPILVETASKPEKPASKKQMYEERGYKVTARPRSVVVNPLTTWAPVAAATALPHRLEPLVPPSAVTDSAQLPQPSQRPSRRREEAESTSSESSAQSRRLGRARSHELVMPRQPREQRWNLERIEFRPPDNPFRGDFPVLCQSRPVRGQNESRYPSRSSSSREEPRPRKRTRNEFDDQRGPANLREMPHTFSARDMREIRGMLRSCGRPPHRLRTPRSSEADPVVRGYPPSSSRGLRPGRHERTQVETGSREGRYGGRREGCIANEERRSYSSVRTGPVLMPDEEEQNSRVSCRWPLWRTNPTLRTVEATVSADNIDIQTVLFVSVL